MHHVLFALLIVSAGLALPTAPRLMEAATAGVRVVPERPAQVARAMASRAVARAPGWHWAGELQQAMQRDLPATPSVTGGEAHRLDGRAVAATLRDLHALLARGPIPERPHRF